MQLLPENIFQINNIYEDINLYPFKFYIFNYTKGKSLKVKSISNEILLNLAEKLNYLRSQQIKPQPDKDNFYRGGDLSIYKENFYNSLNKYPKNKKKLIDIFEKSLTTMNDNQFIKNPCLVHGDLYPSNILVCKQKINLIDWTCCANGDPACDYAILWYLKFKQRNLLIKNLKLDQNTINRAMGWCLWKALLSKNYFAINQILLDNL